MEFAFSIARGGWEPTACTGHLISASGRGRLVSIAIEPRNHVRAINYLVAGEWLHAGRLAAAVHLSRRTLQLLLATKSDPCQPSFDGLEPYMEHMYSSPGMVRAPECKKLMAEHQKVEVFMLLRHRPMRDEEEAERVKRYFGGCSVRADGCGRGRSGGKYEARGAAAPPANGS